MFPETPFSHLYKRREKGECRGQSPLPGSGVSPEFPFSLAAAGGESEREKSGDTQQLFISIYDFKNNQ